jgi:putative heme-binding domain-containing protein
LVTIVTTSPLAAQSKKARNKETIKSWPWREFIEPNFPFFSTTFDARPKDDRTLDGNLVPRALVFPMAADCFLAYDVDLLRVAAVWTADDPPLVNANLAVNSYPYRLNKVDAGTNKLPHPNGTIWFQNGNYAGVGTGEPRILDPRPNLPDDELVVRGGLDPSFARFLGIDLSDGVTIEYEVGSVRVRERFTQESQKLVRHLQVSPNREPVFLVLSQATKDIKYHGDGCTIKSLGDHIVCLIEPSTQSRLVSVSCSLVETGSEELSVESLPTGPTQSVQRRWETSVRLPLGNHETDQVLNLEEIPLPLQNPYGRAVRPADISFFASGRAALVTLDGDVWLCDGLQLGSREVIWRRFTSGLHEPLSIRIRDEEVFVFDRSGLWRLLDRDTNGEADYHELFCSRIHQTAETREFPLSMELQNDGGFLVSKPGQEGIFSGILRVSPDGSEVKLIASGFRQPYLGYDPHTGQIVASDQQGEWVPSSPVHFIEQGGFYGFRRSETLDDLPVTPPLTWIPHAECGSATSIIWMRNAKMGPLNDKPILLCYQPPQLMQVHVDIDETATQGGVTPLDLGLNSNPVMKAAINPSDGLLYLTGFKIWGTSAEKVTFFGRVHSNSDLPWTIPSQAQVEQRGILLRFEQPLDPEFAMQREAYNVRCWNYKRTSAYGSGHYRHDGTAGTEMMGISSVKLSEDRKSVFLGIPNMRTVMQIEVRYDLALDDRTPFQHQTFLTAHALRKLDLVEIGFANSVVDLDSVPLPVRPTVEVTPTAAQGATLYTQLGCIGCHSVDGSMAGKNGPSWLALYGSQRKLTKSGEVVNADDAYLRESILDPSAKIAEGAINGEAGMPVYAGILRDDQVDSLLLFIKALTDKKASAELMQAASTVTKNREWKVNDFRDELKRPLSGRSFESGKMVFLGASCFSCHRIGDGKGGTLGPDLSKLDKELHGLELLRHIIEPSLRIDDKYKSRMILTVDGIVHTGFIVFENETEVRITGDPLSNRAPVLIQKSEIDLEKLSDLSPMPVGALNSFDRFQVLDLLAYIESLANPGHSAFEAP